MSGAASGWDVVNPAASAPPSGFNHGMLAPSGGRLLLIAGQAPTDGSGRVVEQDFAAQFERALRNVLAVVEAAGGEAAHLGRLTIYVTDKREYAAKAKEIGRAYRERMGKHYPAMALVQVAALLEDRAKVEIEATAVIPT